MNDESIARIKYYKGQMLTAQDFEDQQNYHRERLGHLLRRFPYGIISGLDVQFGKDDDGYDALVIKEGLAVDKFGNQIIVSGESIKIPYSAIDPESRYLSLKYTEEEYLKRISIFDSDNKNNRIKEGAEPVWKNEPNFIDDDNEESLITVAWITGEQSSDFKIVKDKDTMGRFIRIDARLVDNELIFSNAITTDKIKNKAVTTDKIDDGAITEDKLAKGSVTKDKLADIRDLISDNDITSSMIAEANNVPDDSGNYQNTNFGVGIKTGHIANEAITTAKIEQKNNNDKIQSVNIADGAVDTDQLALEAVTTAKIEKTNNADKIQGVNIANGAVDTDQLALEAVTTAKIEKTNNADKIQGVNIANGAVDTDQLALEAVTTAKIEKTNNADKIQGVNIANGAVDTDQLALEAVTTAKIEKTNNADKIQGVNIANGAVDTDQLALEAVTTAKIEKTNNADKIQGVNIANGAVDTDQLALEAVTTAKIEKTNNADKIQEINIGTGAVNTDQIAAEAVISTKLAITKILEEQTLDDVNEVKRELNINPDAIVQVVPIIDKSLDGYELLWNYRMKKGTIDGTILYIITIKNNNFSNGTPWGYQIRAITFNTPPPISSL